MLRPFSLRCFYREGLGLGLHFLPLASFRTSNSKLKNMNSKLIWANFSVKDAKRTTDFYTKLGFKPSAQHGYPKLASFRFAHNDLIIHFFERGSQIDEYINTGAVGEIIFTLAAQTEAEVKEWAERVRSAGGTFFKEPARDENNYYGFGFADPDGHRFNVLLMEKGM